MGAIILPVKECISVIYRKCDSSIWDAVALYEASSILNIAHIFKFSLVSLQLVASIHVVVTAIDINGMLDSFRRHISLFSSKPFSVILPPLLRGRGASRKWGVALQHGKCNTIQWRQVTGMKYGQSCNFCT